MCCTGDQTQHITWVIISLLFEGLRFLNLFRAFNDRFLCHKTGKVILKTQIPPFVQFRGALLVGWGGVGGGTAMITERKKGWILICFQFVYWHKQIAQSNKIFGVLFLLGWRAAKNVPQVCVFFWWRIEDLVPSVCCGQGKWKERGCYGNVNTWVAAQTGLPRVRAAVTEVRGAKWALLMAPSFL